MPRVLLTGFEPFGEFKRNPSWDALALAERRGWLPKTRVHLARIPVTYARAFAAFRSAVTAFKPQVAVCFGVHGSRDSQTLYIERVGRNRNGASLDNDGVAKPGVILPRFGAEIPTRYPTASLQVALQEAGFHAALSDDAGQYLCNHLYFRASAAYMKRFPVLFVHVPPVGETGLSLPRLGRAAAMVAWHAAMVCVAGGP